MSASNYVHLDVEEILRGTEKAFLVLLEDDEEVWLPLSQIKDADDYAAGDVNCTITITKWLAEQKGLNTHD